MIAELFGLHESIECKNANVVALKIEPSMRALNHPIIGRCIKYLCSRNGHAIIRKELDPKQSWLNNPNAKLDEDDKIQAVRFFVLVKGLKVHAIEFNGVFSGRHNCNTFTTNSDFTVAQISEPFPGKDVIKIHFPDDYVLPTLQLTKKRIERL